MATQSQIEAFRHANLSGFIDEMMLWIFEYAAWKRKRFGHPRAFSQGEVESFFESTRGIGPRFRPLERVGCLVRLKPNWWGLYYKYTEATDPFLPGDTVKDKKGKQFGMYLKGLWSYRIYQSKTPVQRYRVGVAPTADVPSDPPTLLIVRRGPDKPIELGDELYPEEMSARWSEIWQECSTAGWSPTQIVAQHFWVDIRKVKGKRTWGYFSPPPAALGDLAV